jgi:hypothetical protein
LIFIVCVWLVAPDSSYWLGPSSKGGSASNVYDLLSALYSLDGSRFAVLSSSSSSLLSLFYRRFLSWQSQQASSQLNDRSSMNMTPQNSQNLEHLLAHFCLSLSLNSSSWVLMLMSKSSNQ